MALVVLGTVDAGWVVGPGRGVHKQYRLQVYHRNPFSAEGWDLESGYTDPTLRCQIPGLIGAKEQ